MAWYLATVSCAMVKNAREISSPSLAYHAGRISGRQIPTLDLRLIGIMGFSMVTTAAPCPQGCLNSPDPACGTSARKHNQHAKFFLVLPLLFCICQWSITSFMVPNVLPSFLSSKQNHFYHLVLLIHKLTEEVSNLLP